MDSRNATLEKEIETLRQTLREKQQDCVDLEERLESEVLAVKAHSDDCVVELDRRLQKVHALEAERDTLFQRCRNFEAEVLRNSEVERELNQNVTTLQCRIADLQTELENRANSSAINVLANVTQTDAKKLEEENAALWKQVKFLNLRIEQQTAPRTTGDESSHPQREVEELRKQNTELKDRIQQLQTTEIENSNFRTPLFTKRLMMWQTPRTPGTPLRDVSIPNYNAHIFPTV
jgi:uncharacterized protein YdcH (DUF465 family)